jgi:hypothetical protein
MSAIVLIGWVPAAAASRRDLVTVLSIDRTGTIRGARARLRTAFVVLQLAVSVPLLITALLFTRSMMVVSIDDAGIDARGVLTFNIDLEGRGYSEERGRLFYRELRERLRALPGVRSVNLSMFVPLTLGAMSAAFLPEGQTPPPPGSPAGERLPIYTNTSARVTSRRSAFRSSAAATFKKMTGRSGPAW